MAGRTGVRDTNRKISQLSFIVLDPAFHKPCRRLTRDENENGWFEPDGSAAYDDTRMIDVSLMEEPKKKGSITYRRWALPFSMFDTNNKMARMRGNVNAGSKSAKRRVEEVYYKTLNESNVQACKTGKWFRVTELQPGQVEGVPSTDVAPSGLVASVFPVQRSRSTSPQCQSWLTNYLCPLQCLRNLACSMWCSITANRAEYNSWGSA